MKILRFYIQDILISAKDYHITRSDSQPEVSREEKRLCQRQPRLLVTHSPARRHIRDAARRRRTSMRATPSAPCRRHLYEDIVPTLRHLSPEGCHTIDGIDVLI